MFRDKNVNTNQNRLKPKNGGLFMLVTSVLYGIVASEVKGGK